MPTREFESEIAVKVALLRPSDIDTLGELEKLANIVAANAAEKVPRALAHLLVSQLERFMREVLGFHSGVGPLQEGNSMDRFPDVRSSDAADVVHRLLALTSGSTLTDNAVGRDVFDQVKWLLGRFCQLVMSVHAAREFCDEGWQWGDFNSGWENGLCNSEYELSLVWRALRSQDEAWLPPKDPAGSGRIADFITYWYSLSSVVLGHLAWSNPSVGMARWVNSGMPDDGATLSGLKRLYGADAAALILNPHVPELANLIGVRALGLRDAGLAPLDPSSTLLERQDINGAVGKSRRWSAMLCGGSDPLHLSEHLRRLLLRPGLRPVRLAGAYEAISTPQVHLLLADGYGWYEALHLHADRLPSRPDGRSWRVDVTSATLGYIGEFRKSRETGRWFAGKHSSHMLGN